jgi:hypothetical protein
LISSGMVILLFFYSLSFIFIIQHGTGSNAPPSAMLSFHRFLALFLTCFSYLALKMVDVRGFVEEIKSA